MTALRRLADRVFKVEEINGGHRCPTYLYRWTLFQPRRPRRLWHGFGVYLHHFVGDDWSRDLHDHPKRFISIGLRGRYIEWTPAPNKLEPGDDPYIYPCGCSKHKVAFGLCSEYSDISTVYRAPWIRTFPAEHIHRITMVGDEECWTLVIVLRHVREWGFWHEGRFIHWREYVKGASSWIADKMRACP